ncbi:MAG: hypothetical protein WBL67_17115 [Nitrososphaeraceae archaeon]
MKVVELVTVHQVGPPAIMVLATNLVIIHAVVMAKFVLGMIVVLMVRVVIFVMMVRVTNVVKTNTVDVGQGVGIHVVMANVVDRMRDVVLMVRVALIVELISFTKGGYIDSTEDHDLLK